VTSLDEGSVALGRAVEAGAHMAIVLRFWDGLHWEGSRSRDMLAPHEMGILGVYTS